MMDNIILHGDVYACLNQLEDNSVAVAITSPPYWKQRNYGFSGQIGQENLPEEYIGKLLTIFNKLKDKLRSDGVFFLNIGDKYLNRYGKSHLLQIPYRLAYHMVKNGWYLKDIIIWYKTNHMPSSVNDRFSNTYEPILVFVKNENNIYKNGLGNVVKIPLQQTPWKHTAVFPEKLVEEMLRRTDLKDGDIVLDPFAGTGTVAAVVKNYFNNLFFKKIYSVMIEKGDDYLDIIKNRANIKKIINVDDIQYIWKPVKEEDLPDFIEPYEILNDKYGEVFIAETNSEFLSAIRGITSQKFKRFHREDALYFFGIKNWTLQDLYYMNSILNYGYVLRNMLIISNERKWYPIFMFAKDSTILAYKFYLDRIRVEPIYKEKLDWSDEYFIGKRVLDISRKKIKDGKVVGIVEKYDDNFPKIVIVQYDGYASFEFVLHPQKDVSIREGLLFKCPKCGSEIDEYDPAGENVCPNCKTELWVSLDTIPIIEEPEEIINEITKLDQIDSKIGIEIKIEDFEEKKKLTKSKFLNLDRINWGASPGARKLMIGDYFTKMRLYKVYQPMVAQYLTILRKNKGLSIEDITKILPSSYKHTIGHWFRKDFGGSIPLPEDISLLKKIFGVENDKFLNILERVSLKFQTIKPSEKGKNPGDFIEEFDEKHLVYYLQKLYLPSQIYFKSQQK